MQETLIEQENVYIYALKLKIRKNNDWELHKHLLHLYPSSFFSNIILYANWTFLKTKMVSNQFLPDDIKSIQTSSTYMK